MRGQRGSAVGALWALYQHSLATKPLPTKVATSALLSGMGDATAQLAIEKKELLDRKRLAIFTALGGVLVAPALHTWYATLIDRIPGGAAPQVAKRVLCDQLLFAPLMLPTFMGAMLVLEGKPDPLAEIERAYWPALVANWKIWTPASTINFGLVPPHLQVLFANGVSFIWNSYLSYVSHASKPP